MTDELWTVAEIAQFTKLSKKKAGELLRDCPHHFRIKYGGSLSHRRISKSDFLNDLEELKTQL